MFLKNWGRLSQWLIPLPLTSEENSKKSKLLANTVLAMFITDIIACVSGLLESQNKVSTTITFYGVIFFVLIGFAMLLRKGKVATTGWLLVIFFWLVVAFATLFFGGLRGQIAVVFVVVIMFMGSFLGGRAAIILALITIYFLGLVAYLETKNLMPTQLGPDYTPLNAWSGLCVAIMLMSVLLNSSLTSIKESEERFQLAVRGSASGLWDWNILTNDVYFSTTYKEMLGYSPTEFPPNFSSFYESMHPADLQTMKKSLDDHFVSRKKYDVEFRLRTKSGEYRWFQTKGEAVFDSQNKPHRMVGSMVDITTRKIAEESIALKNEELQKINSELDRFVYSASHDLRAPISSLLGLIEVARLENDPSSLKRLLDMQQRSLLKLDNFIFDIVNYSRNNRVEVSIEKIDFNSLLNETYDLLHHLGDTANIKKVKEVDPDLVFYSDRKRLSVVLTNLISNAIKYCDPSKEDAFIKTVIEETEDGVRIHIIDNGEGIGEEHRDKIFEMFYRASERSTGSGIGLYIVKEVVQKLRGNISINSEKYKGSEFVVQLPNLKDYK
jgi:PAS domain S-box-containing protein